MKARLWVALKLAERQYLGKEITIYEELDGEPVADIITGTAKSVGHIERRMINGRIGYTVQVLVSGIDPKYGFATAEYVDMRKIKWNRQKQRFEAPKSEVKGETLSDSMRRVTSGPGSSSLPPTGWHGKGPFRN